MVCQEARLFSGLRHFQKKESRLKMNHEFLHLQESMKMSTESVHKESLPQGQTFNQHFYREVLKKTLKKGHSCEIKHKKQIGIASR